jgi:hypothetical protein
MMKFLDSVRQGMDKAKIADASKNEVNQVFLLINTELSTFDPALSIEIKRDTSTAAQAAFVAKFFTAVTSEYFPEDQVSMTIKNGDNT